MSPEFIRLLKGDFIVLLASKERFWNYFWSFHLDLKLYGLNQPSVGRAILQSLLSNLPVLFRLLILIFEYLNNTLSADAATWDIIEQLVSILKSNHKYFIKLLSKNSGNIFWIGNIA
jgi:hypothetical protein